MATKDLSRPPQRGQRPQKIFHRPNAPPFGAGNVASSQPAQPWAQNQNTTDQPKIPALRWCFIQALGDRSCNQVLGAFSLSRLHSLLYTTLLFRLAS